VVLLLAAAVLAGCRTVLEVDDSDKMASGVTLDDRPVLAVVVVRVVADDMLSYVVVALEDVASVW
jgi:hypothetical protein